ncbi:tRNA uridine-5-carboxymethylaminomethyl(34) synthesis GTPase MnmE [Candidatus Halobeggiatoa sp. HSG11]|nr:tRNA uridine-5-carboxymethylaminomethyl(34) synthesis GTPase MnmE [Candidatus Halobeggiatoa sp. HSG11]
MHDTIAALATPVGRGGIGVVRISGSWVVEIAKILLKKLPKPRYAVYGSFYDVEGKLIDQGIALYFPAPNSFTGEDVLELQGHGGPIVMDLLLNTVINLGARLAHPGEFSERAFLNDKMDLVQAEAIADLIDSSSKQAVRCALRSLQGEFSFQINSLVEKLIWLRSYVEAGIDFSDEEIDLLEDGQIIVKIKELIKNLDITLTKAQQGYLLKEGMQIVLVGEPNVGKSSLLNCLAGRDTAIVTPLPGTTRDVIREQIQIDGMPLHITDTAGLRETEDIIEQEGIRRTKLAIEAADLVILLLDDNSGNDYSQTLQTKSPFIIHNKIDLSQHPAGMQDGILYLSAKTGEGIDILKEQLKKKVGFQGAEGNFMARSRHLDALQRAKSALMLALKHSMAFELLAEELRQAQQALNEITGEFTSDDLLGQIFSTFCLGK